MKTKVLFLFLLQLAIAQAAPQILAEKPLRAELKRYFNSTQYSFRELTAPSKYSVNGKFYEIQSPGNTKVKYVYAGKVSMARGKGGGANVDFLEYFILYNPSQVVQKVKIYNFQSSHGEGVTAAGWLKQFNGYSSQKSLEVGKNIDAISGATISVNNLTFDVQSKTKILAEITK